MSQLIDISTLDRATQEALLAQLKVAQKALKEADTERLSSLALPLAETVVRDRTAEDGSVTLEHSEKSGWHGIKVFSIPVEVDGRKYTISATVSDVERTTEGKAAVKAAADAAGETAPAEPESDEESDTDAGEEPAPEPEPVSLAKPSGSRSRK